MRSKRYTLFALAAALLALLLIAPPGADAHGQAHHAAKAKKKDGPVHVSCCGSGLKVAGGDSELRLTGRLLTQLTLTTQVDSKKHEGFHGQFSLKEAYVELYARWKTLSGFVQGDFDVSSATVQEAWVEWAAGPWLAVRAGRDYVPFGMAQAVATIWSPFIERPALTGNAKDHKDIGGFVKGTIAGGSLAYALAVYNGSRDLSPKENELPDVAARVAWEPLALLPGAPAGAGILHFGGSFRWGKGPSRQGFKGATPAGFSFFSPPEIEGSAWGAAAEIAFWHPWFSLVAEFQYTHADRDHIEYTDPVTYATFEALHPLKVYGYYVGASSLLWGKPGAFRGGTPPGTGLRPLKGIEIAARFEQLWIEDGKAPDAPLEEQRVWDVTAGFNGYPTGNLIIQAHYVLFHFDPESAAPVPGEALSHAAIVRAGLRF